MEYQQILDAIANYYGKGDIWTEFAKYGNMSGMDNVEMVNAMKQVPGVRAVVNGAGETIAWEYVADEAIPASATTQLAQQVNSNIGNAAASAGSSASNTASQTMTKVKTPINTTTNAGGAITSMKTGVMQTGKFTFADVLGPVAAVGTGIALGKKISPLLYQAAPDFWESYGVKMEFFNPEAWATITNGEPGIANGLFNTIFGINTETGTTQPYISQEAFAYLTGYMIEKGVFAPAETTGTTGSGYTQYTPESQYSPFSFIEAQINYPYPGNYGSRTFSITNATAPVYMVQGAVTGRTYSDVYLGSEAPFKVGVTGSTPDNAWSTTYQGKRVYYSSFNTYATNIIAPIINSTSSTEQRASWDMVFASKIESGGGIDGITDQDGATQFDASGISDPTDISEVLSALQTQFPDLFSNAVTNTVLQDDGTTKDIVYVPIGFPQINDQHPDQPTGDIATQDKPYYDPSDDPTGDIGQKVLELISYKFGYDGNTPTANPDPVTDPNPPDTGNGTSTPVIVPAGSASALFSVYNPTQAQIDSFGAWLWSTNFVDQLLKMFNDPMESIISLHKVFATPVTGGAQNIYVGYLDSGVSSTTVSSQYADVDCGQVILSEYFGNVLDYTDTHIDLYLPFIGIVPLSPDDVMRSAIHVIYHVDVLTGACLADVEITRDAGGGILYQYAGDCAVHYPVSAGSYMGIVSGLLSIAGGVAGTVATGGAALPVLMGAGSAMLGSHTRVERTGGFSANAGAMGAKIPYLIISRPQTAMPQTYLTMEGVGSNQTVVLNTCAGLTRVKEVILNNIAATDEEINEIERLLKEGVFL